jgi:PKD repeat protein
MNKLSKITAAILLSAMITNTSAQELKCSTDEMVRQSLQANPSLLPAYLAEEARLAQIDADAAANNYQSRELLPIYTIPVVFHILHMNGTENISDAQVMDAMRILNEDFRKTNADFANTVADFLPIAADCEVEFKLAQKDPAGNCTNGIDRIYSAETEIGDDGSKLNQWPRNKYLNIWVVRTIQSGAAGYSYLPGTTASANDGIMILSSYVGAIGTGSVTRSHALGHEVGHWLNLKHTWGNTNDPGIDCSGTDNVSDTPPTEGWTSCNLAGATCGSTLDNVQNFMEYSYCSTMFTNGQKTRLRTALTSTISQRSSLWTSSNLTATGVSLPAVLCQANFSSNKDNTFNTFCQGDSITFTDQSWNGDPTAWLWSFPGGTPSTSTLENPTVVYNTPGTYDVSLTVSNASGSVSATKSSYVFVNPTTAMYSGPMMTESFETSTSVPNANWDVRNTNAGSNTWVQTSAAAVTGNNSVMITNTSSSVGQVDDLIGPSVNMTLISGSAPVLTFKVAYAQRTSTSNDKLQVYVSTTCGQSWSLRKTITGATLSTGGVQTGSFVPTASQWSAQSVNLGSYAGESNLYYMFKFTSNGGNNIYLDDINILASVGIDELGSNLNYQLFPNPAETNSMVSFELIDKAETSIEVIDVAGRRVSFESKGALPAGEYQYPVSSKELAKGIYVVSLKVGGQSFSKKLVIR